MKPWIAKDHLNFRQDYADRALKFFPSVLRHHSGRWGGQRFTLEPFQQSIISEIFGRVDEFGHRYIREFCLFVPKKNGKSPLGGGIVCKLLFADNENAPHVYGAASDREQAGLVFGYVSGMIGKSPKLGKRCKVLKGRKQVDVPASYGFYHVVSAEVSHKHGYNSHGVIVDEIHALPDFELWDVLTTCSGAAREQALFGSLTTAGVVGESPVAEEKYEESVEILTGVRPCPDWFFPVVWAADKDADWTDKTVWESCNPAYGRFLDPKAVRLEFEKAEKNLRNQNNFRRYRLNQWVNQAEQWIDLDVWDACADRAFDPSQLKDYPCCVGIDLSSRIDLTAVVAVFALPGRRYVWWPMFWAPEETLDRRDSVEADSYARWIKAGWMKTCKGAEIQYGDIEKHIKDLRTQGFKIKDLVFDPMFAGQLAQRLEKERFTATAFSQRGYAHWTEPAHELEAAMDSARLTHDGNPVMRWCANCVKAKTGPNGEIRPEKPDRRKTKKRIDGIAAGLMGMKAAMVEAPRRSVYESSETAVM